MPTFSLNYNKQANISKLALNSNEGMLRQAVQRLSTGKKFNAPGDGPASFSLLSKMGSDLSLGEQGVVNAQNGTSMINTIDAGLANIEKIFTDLGVLAEDAANGIWTDEQRKVFDSQAKHLLTVANDIALSTNFNGNAILSKNYKLTLQIGTTNQAHDQITLSFSPARTAAILGSITGAHKTISLSTQKAAINSIDAIQQSLIFLRGEREKYGAVQKAIEFNIANRQSMNEQAKATISNIGDADVATEMENYTNYTAKVQASQYMYTVAMQNPSKIAQMIQSI